MKKIGIFGGVYNPPHNFHFAVAQEILNNDNDFEKIIFVPVGNKYVKNGIIDAELRYDMLKLVCDENQKFEVSRIEIDHDVQNYAYQTLDSLSKFYPDYELVFIIGTDSLKSFETWKRFEYLLDAYSFLVYNRGGDDFYEILNNHPVLKDFKNKFQLANCEVTANYNSTHIREELKSGKSVQYLLPEKVNLYIKEHSLYK